MHWNIHRINSLKKLDKKSEMELMNYDILGLCETWHTNSTLIHDLFNDDFKIYEIEGVRENNQVNFC
jgi:hypothetical protein